MIRLHNRSTSSLILTGGVNITLPAGSQLDLPLPLALDEVQRRQLARYTEDHDIALSGSSIRRALEMFFAGTSCVAPRDAPPIAAPAAPFVPSADIAFEEIPTLGVPGETPVLGAVEEVAPIDSTLEETPVLGAIEEAAPVDSTLEETPVLGAVEEAAPVDSTLEEIPVLGAVEEAAPVDSTLEETPVLGAVEEAAQSSSEAVAALDTSEETSQTDPASEKVSDLDATPAPEKRTPGSSPKHPLRVRRGSRTRTA